MYGNGGHGLGEIHVKMILLLGIGIAHGRIALEQRSYHSRP